ncbi:hypothetical protein PV396_40300 [Streptomyces sp. ME02-8801-2C]|uniref:hypothetical protein n=1 Tax=Streptomyces sp. ME02-8801-2C TaxID=3028680 RepID=UPI0029AD10A2|nr:hypothetical protein [Streptomyces sp. ME02-8801-2C]MDX3458112.1 hypothetical protein [Streptomyces sp. ME02-8801-2C]
MATPSSEPYESAQQSEPSGSTEFSEPARSSEPSKSPENPSDEEVLQSVERYLSGRGNPVRLVAPGTAELSRQPLLEFRIDRRFEERHPGVPERVPGKKLKQIAKRPSYTDLATHQVPVPAGFQPTLPVRLVLAGSVAEGPCPDCAAGKRDCDTCGGSGTQDCPELVACDGCGGGSDSCWSCGGNRRPGSRKPPPNASPRTDWCRRCAAPKAACPKCVGFQTMTCPVCDGKRRRKCEACNGAKRVRHKPCEGTGFFTTFIEARITHPVESEQERVAAPAHLRWRTQWRAGWREKRLHRVTDKLPADLPETLRGQVEPQLALAEREVARLATLRYLPVARVTVDADPDWVYFAFPGRSESAAPLNVVRRPAKQRVLRLVGIASAAVVVALLVTLLVLSVTG